MSQVLGSTHHNNASAATGSRSPPPVPPSPTKSIHRSHQPTSPQAAANGEKENAGGARGSRAGGKHEPTMAELLAQTSGGPGPHFNDGSGFMSDVRGEGGLVSWRKGQGFRAWETAVLSSPEVRRKANVAQLYFYDYCACRRRPAEAMAS